MLLDEVRDDLAGVPADSLLPPLRRGQALAWTAIEDATPLGEGTAIAIARLTDGRAINVPLVHDGRWRRAEPDDAISASALSAPHPLAMHIIHPLPPIDQRRAGH